MSQKEEWGKLPTTVAAGFPHYLPPLSPGTPVGSHSGVRAAGTWVPSPKFGTPSAVLVEGRWPLVGGVMETFRLCWNFKCDLSRDRWGRVRVQGREAAFPRKTRELLTDREQPLALRLIPQARGCRPWRPAASPWREQLSSNSCAEGCLCSHRPQPRLVSGFRACSLTLCFERHAVSLPTGFILTEL